jgi:outer membrane lipoprotein carrier protein
MQTCRHPLLAVALAIAAAAPQRALSQSASAVVDKAVAAWSTVRTLSGTFEQKLDNPLVRTTATARGEFRQERPNKLAVRFTDPAGDAIVADGKFVWLFIQQATPGQVIRRATTDRTETPIDIGQFLDAPATRFDIVAKGAENVGTRPAQVLALTPKKGTRAPFTRATDSMIRQFEIVEGNGLTRRIRLTSLDINPKLSAADFSFKVPKGVKVVER